MPCACYYEIIKNAYFNCTRFVFICNFEFVQEASNMNARIRTLRKTLGLSQTEFGERIGLRQASVSCSCVAPGQA